MNRSGARGPERQRHIRLPQDSLLRQPARAILTAAAIFMAISSLLPWATAMAITGEVAFNPHETSDGLLLVVFGSLLVVSALSQGISESGSRSVQLVGLVLALACGAVWITAEHSARQTIVEWRQRGWVGSETAVVPLTLVAVLVAIAATVWIDRRRSEALRRRTVGLVREWEVSRSSVIKTAGAVIGGVLGAGGGLALGVAITGGSAYGALLFILLSAFGMLLGARLGASAGSVVARRVHAT